MAMPIIQVFENWDEDDQKEDSVTSDNSSLPNCKLE